MKAGEGFFIALQDKLMTGDWRYVSNQTGGFLGFWYYWNGNENHSLYIQVENAFEYGIKLVVKISDWVPEVSTLYSILTRLSLIAVENGLTLVKPERFRTGETSTVAVLKDAFPVDNEGLFDIDKFITILHTLEKVLDQYFEREVKKITSQSM